MAIACPGEVDDDNIAYEGQLKSLGFALDWKRELATCRRIHNEPVALHAAVRRASRIRRPVSSLGPVDQTVLARAGDRGPRWRTGRWWRSANPDVLLRITSYAEELLAALDARPAGPSRSS